MRENIGKIITSIVLIVFILTVGWIFSAALSKPENMDMLIVWLIFAASDIKSLIQSSWSVPMIVIGMILLIAFAIYYFIRMLGAYEKELGIDEKDEPAIKSRGKWTEDEELKYQKLGKPLIRSSLFLLTGAFAMQLLAAGIPNAKQAAVIYVVSKIINNVDMREIPPNLARLVNEGLKDMIKDLQKDAKGAVEAAKEDVRDKVAEGIQKGLEEATGKSQKQ